MKKKSKKITQYIAYSLLISGLLTLLCLMLLAKFPLIKISDDFSQEELKTFTHPWPQSSLKEEFKRLKKIKKYKQEERERRTKIQLRRMEYVNTQLTDVLNNDKTYIISEKKHQNFPIVNFQWPYFKILDYLPIKNSNSKKPIFSFIIPTETSSHIYTATFLSLGEELRTSLPITKLRRNFTFQIFPLSPGKLSIQAGQYFWDKTISDEHVHMPVEFHLPINDSTTDLLRVKSETLDFFFYNAYVNQLEKSARSNIYVSKESPLWDVSKENLSRKDVSLDNLERPLNEKQNPSKYYNQKLSVGLGYNLIYLNIGKIPVLSESNKSLAPTLYHLTKNSLILTNHEKTPINSQDAFRRIISPNYKEDDALKRPYLSFLINNDFSFNSYKLLRKYGYRVLSVGTPETFFLPSKIAELSMIPHLTGKWLNESDWLFYKQKYQNILENAPKTGLEAIFSQRTSIPSLPLLKDDYSLISDYNSLTLRDKDYIHWGASQLITINDKFGFYMSKLLHVFKKWMEDHWQKRIFAHLYLDPFKVQPKIPLKDLFGPVLDYKSKLIFSPNSLLRSAHIRYLDRALKEFLDIIKTNYIENRTIIVLEGLEPKTQKTYHIIKFPGLVSKGQRTLKYNSGDMIKTLLSNLGISHFQYSLKQKDSLETQRSLEESHVKSSQRILNQNENKTRGIMTKYELFLLNLSKNLPKPFEWEALDDTVFDVKCSEPIEEVNIARKRLTFFPTHFGQDTIKCEWIQFQENKEKIEHLADSLGGQIKLSDESDLPIVLYGPSFQSTNSFLLEQESLSPSLVKKLFYWQKKENSEEEIVKKFQLFKKLNFPHSRKTFLILILTALNS